MKLLHLKTGPMEVNTYIVFDPAQTDCVVIDPGAEPERIKERLQEYNLNCTAVLLTHGHFDHIGAVRALQSDGAKVYIHAVDAELLHDGKRNLGYLADVTVEPSTADVLLNGGETLNLAGVKFEVLHTPGHTPGGVCYVSGHNLFSGDTLFREGVGRTDFPNGDAAALYDSIKNKLFRLPDDYNVYPGHDAFTTLDYEREHNPEVNRPEDVYGF